MYIDRMKRGTGRTHNMVVAAFAYAMAHGAATVVMSDDKDMDHAMRSFAKTPAFSDLFQHYEIKLIQNRLNPKFLLRSLANGCTTTIYFLSAKNVNIEWYQFRVIGVDEKATFFDHHAIELHFAGVLERWTRYDNKLSNLNAGHAQRHFENEESREG